jgi:hypothetical protein
LKNYEKGVDHQGAPIEVVVEESRKMAVRKSMKQKKPFEAVVIVSFFIFFIFLSTFPKNGNHRVTAAKCIMKMKMLNSGNGLRWCIIRMKKTKTGFKKNQEIQIKICSTGFTFYPDI